MRDSFRDWRIITPIVVLTFFFPFLAQWTAGRISGFLATYGAEYIGEQFIPFLLMIVGFFPISISLVIALETFVGEKERRSLEPLLSTPLTNSELYIGKTLAAMIPPLTASFGGMSFYLVTLYLRGADWQPPPLLIVQIFVLTIVQALVMVTGAVVVSLADHEYPRRQSAGEFHHHPDDHDRERRKRDYFPRARRPIAERDFSPYGSLLPGWWSPRFCCCAWAIASSTVKNCWGRAIDTLNLTGIGKKIWRYMRAIDDSGTPARTPLEWYTKAIPYSLSKLGRPALVTIGVFIVYFAIGYVVGQMPGFRLPLNAGAITVENVTTGGFGGMQEGQAFWFIFGQNGRVMLLALGLSAFSFGVAAYILMPPCLLFSATWRVRCSRWVSGRSFSPL